MPFFVLRRAWVSCALPCALLWALPAYSQLLQLGDGPPAPVAPDSKTLGRSAATAAPSAASDWYDTLNRETVRTAYNSVYSPTIGTPLGYVGDPTNGIAGDTSAAYKNAILTRINVFRRMGGVSSITGLDPIRNAKAQQGALMMYAAKQITHSAGPGWPRFTTDGAEALAKSNVCRSSQADIGCIAGYMDDPGSNNTEAGHRRWILFPQTQQMATGDVPDVSNQLWSATWVQEPTDIMFGTRPATRDGFVAWPPKGYVPYQVVYNRWSFHYPKAGFTGATVSVTRNGVPVPVRIDSAAAAIPENTVNAPENQIVFVLDNAGTNTPTVPVNPGVDTTYTVTINNVLINGTPQTFSYNVIVFDPATAGTPVGPGAPSVVSFSPLTGAGFSGTFTATFKQSSHNHYLGYMLFLPTPNIVWYTATGSCLVEYNKFSHGVRLIDNLGTGWLGGQSGIPIAPGAGTLTNNQCSVNVANVVATISADTMTVTVPVTFFAALGPVLGTFLQALDSNGVWTGMTQFGNHVLPARPQTRLGPSVAAFNATATAGTQSTYTIIATHTAGASQVSMVHLLTSAAIVGAPACQFVYFPGSSLLNLINDSGTALVSASGIVVGQSGTLANSRCSVNVAAATQSQTVNTVSLTLPVTYTPAFAGQKNVYVNAFDTGGMLTHWVQGSTMLVQ